VKGLRKINECGKMTVVEKLFIWVRYRDQRKRTIVAENSACRMMDRRFTVFIRKV
jgi:hypothetical protein